MCKLVPYPGSQIPDPSSVVSASESYPKTEKHSTTHDTNGPKLGPRSISSKTKQFIVVKFARLNAAHMRAFILLRRFLSKVPLFCYFHELS